MGGRPRLCARCGELIGVDARECPWCGARNHPVLRLLRMRTIEELGLSAARALLAANIAVYGAMVLLALFGGHGEAVGRALSLTGFPPDVLYRMGALVGPLVTAGEWWRLLTSLFLHGGLLHLVMNLVVLFQIGPSVESLYGTRRFLILFMGSGLASSVAVLLFSTSAVGASGALCGLIGALVAYAWRRRAEPQARALLQGMLKWIALIVVLSIVIPVVSLSGHVGGLAGGLLLAALLGDGPVFRERERRALHAGALLSILLPVLGFAVVAVRLFSGAGGG